LKLIPIADIRDPRLTDFTSLTDVQLRKQYEPEHGLYIAESTKVIHRAIRAGHRPRSVLLAEEWIDDLSHELAAFPELPVFVGSTGQLEEVTGFHLHRGALAAMFRPALPTLDTLLQTSTTVVILEGLADHTNVGAVFRTVAAMGADAVLVTSSCADPLYRRSVRVSMGAVLQVPWTRISGWDDVTLTLKNHGFTLVSFALDDASIDLNEFAQQHRESPKRIALVFGAEGNGLTRAALRASDTIIRIPMHNDVDSLNVANTAGIALWALSAQVQ
jgi:tRNA G18 (ribose-2'-O)-methylase SpoU